MSEMFNRKEIVWLFIALGAVALIFALLSLSPHAAPSDISEPSAVSSSPPALLISGWQLYRNEKYGFELQFPKAFTYKDEKSERFAGGELVPIKNPVAVAFTETPDLSNLKETDPTILFEGTLNDIDVSVRVYGKPAGYSTLSAYAEDEKSKDEEAARGSAAGVSYSSKEIVLGKEKAVEVTGFEGSVMQNTSKELYLEHSDYLYQISYGYPGYYIRGPIEEEPDADLKAQIDDEKAKYLIIQKLLGTFRFLP